MSIKCITYDVLVIGCGLSALSTVYSLRKKGYSIALLLSSSIESGGNSSYAQGGIVYTDFLKDPEALKSDILYAGAYDQDETIVEYFAKNAPCVVKKILIDELGIFSEEESRTFLAKEGGHSVKRILYKGDHTGKSIMQAFISLFKKDTSIDYIENAFAYELLLDEKENCIGVKAIIEDKIYSLFAHNTVLATGGVGNLYSKSTNPHPVYASAIAMAYEKNIALSHLEYIQFHPTTLFHPCSKQPFLVSETMRGEGAILINKKGESFAEDYHPLGSLAPRDILTRAIISQMQKDKSECVYLDARHIAHSLQERFPTIYSYCLENIALDIQKFPIPVTPAMHYSCGGIVSDIFGKTSCPHLYAVGECAYTGIHGANRLASTSLLEALFGGTCITDSIEKNPSLSLKNHISEEILFQEENPARCQSILSTIQDILWNNFGIIRKRISMENALKELERIKEECLLFWQERKTKECIKVLHAASASYIIAKQCTMNTLSKGCHYISEE